MTDAELARHVREMNALAFAVVRDGRILATGAADGVAELLGTLERLGDAARGASLSDKIVGKAVALVAAHAGMVEIETPLASEPALAFCLHRGIHVHATTRVPLILNRRADGPCPLEALTHACDEPDEGIAKLRAFLAARQPVR